MTKLNAPPSCLREERAVLAAVLLDDKHIHTLKDIIIPDDFYDLHNRSIYQVMLSMFDQKKRIDTVSLITELTLRNMLNNTGGEEYLIELQSELPDDRMVEHYATTIKDKSILRSLIVAASSIVASCANTTNTNSSELIGNAEQTIFAVTQKKITQPFKSISSLLYDTFKQLSFINNDKTKSYGVMTGYHVKN